MCNNGSRLRTPRTRQCATTVPASVPVPALELHDEAGRPLSGAVVHIRGPHRDERVWPVGEGEAFVVRTLWPGRYRFDLEVDAKGHHAVEVEAGKTVRYVVR